MARTVNLYFDGVEEICTQEEDRNGEYLFVAPSGHFVKFPKDGDLNEMVAAHNEVNNKEVEIIPDVEYGEVVTHDADGNPVK
jgi:hypothetical protein